MEYSDAVIEDAKTKLSVLLGPRNKNPDRYKETYNLIRSTLDKSQKLTIEHREKAKVMISGTISEKRLDYILKKRMKENQSLVKIYLKKREKRDRYPI